MKKPESLLIIVLFFLSCSNVDKKEKQTETAKYPSEKIKIQRNLDTTTIEGKGNALFDELKDSNLYIANFGEKDTLIDMNGDNYIDLLIEFYAQSGTGLKNGTLIYLYDPVSKQFLKDAPFKFANPSFDFKSKTLVNYYIGNGGGYASKLKWNGLKTDTLEYIDVEVDFINKSTIEVTSLIKNYVSGKQTELVTSEVTLPDEYNYWDYTPIIKRED